MIKDTAPSSCRYHFETYSLPLAGSPFWQALPLACTAPRQTPSYPAYMTSHLLPTAPAKQPTQLLACLSALVRPSCLRRQLNRRCRPLSRVSYSWQLWTAANTRAHSHTLPFPSLSLSLYLFFFFSLSLYTHALGQTRRPSWLTL